MDADSKAAYRFCRHILPQVSRTFALNISILVGDLKRAVLTAYLFCRIADTVEDSPQLPSEKKRELLNDFQAIFTEADYRPERLRGWSQSFATDNAQHPYHVLVRNADRVMQVFTTLPLGSQAAISKCVLEMSAGMQDTVEGRDSAIKRLRTLSTLNDLEQYCYYVAGTVGVMLTKLFAQHAPAMSSSAVKHAQQLEVSFGLGLQLTNIIKDCHEDYQRGWCYLPTELAARHGVPIEQLFAVEHRPQARSLLLELIEKAGHHLDDALNYTLLIPRREVRMRLFCLWPLFFAVKTLVAVKEDLDRLLAGERVKITRSEVYATVAESTVLCYSNKLLRRSYERLRHPLKSFQLPDAA
ncbi:MAG: phytoene/squalene synthase family protein [bacterium]